MGLAAVVAGPYSGSFGGSSIGQTQDGFRLRYSVNKETIKSDAYGDSVIDACFRGADVFFIWTGIEYVAALAPFWPYGAFGSMGNVGTLDVGSNLTNSMVITNLYSNTTSAGTPQSLTGLQALIDENFNGELSFRSGARTPPVTQRFYPYSSGGIRWFSTT